MSNKRKRIALFVITLVLILWSVDFIGIEYMMSYASPGAYSLLRLGICCIVMLILCRVRNGGFRVDRKDLPRLAISGACAMTIYLTLENLGVQMTSAALSSLMLSTVPIFGILGDRIFFHRRITPLKIGCILVSVFGVYLMVVGDLSPGRLAGMCVTLTAAAVWAFQIAYVKPLYERYDVLTILTGIFLSGFLIQIPVTLITGFHFVLLPQTAAVTIATSLGCLLLGEAGYLFAIGNLSVTTVSSFENLIPVVTILLSFLVFGTTLTPLQFFAVFLIVGSVMVIAWKE